MYCRISNNLYTLLIHTPPFSRKINANFCTLIYLYTWVVQVQFKLYVTCSRVAIRPEVLFMQYISYVSDDVMKVEFESWNQSTKSVCAATKKQLQRTNRSQFNGTGASSGVELVNTQITVTRTQKQEKLDVSM